ncbi:MAG: hypothetical protein RLQ73_01745 [Hoeflea sp. D1-CHI-28]
MAGYVSPPSPHPLGYRRSETEAKRAKLGLDDKGFRLDGDAAGADKEAMLREIYRRENEKLPYAIGGNRPADAGDDEGEGAN